MKNNRKALVCIIFLTLIASFFRFYNVSWGAPFYFHPDERNIASSVSGLSFPTQMNPHFFAYGSLPIYIIYFTAFIVKQFSHSDLFSLAIVVGRFYSALFSVLLIPLLFFIGKKIRNRQVGVSTAILATTSVGFMQFAHFATFEIWLTFFSCLLFYFCLHYIEYKKIQYIISLWIILGILFAIKISSIIFIIFPIVTFIISGTMKMKGRNNILKYFLKICAGLLLSILVVFITSPFAFLDFHSFISDIGFETSVGLGTLTVFYTGEFLGTVPILFQFIHVFPFLINPVIEILFCLGIFFALKKAIIEKRKDFLLLISFFTVLFLSQAFLFVKWTRYIIPTLPFIYLIVATWIDSLDKQIKKVYFYPFLVIVYSISIIYFLSFYISTSIKGDTRTEAAQWAEKDIPDQSRIISEAYDLGILPFNLYFSHITLFNFYDLDYLNSESKKDELTTLLAHNDYIILSSQRILKTRLLNKESFPNGYEFYKNLTEEKLQFTKIYETPCDIFCKIVYMGNPVYSFEETANVFDRPTLFIFKKE